MSKMTYFGRQKFILKKDVIEKSLKDVFFTFFVSTARRKIRFSYGMPRNGKEEIKNTTQSVKSAAHEKTNNALSLRINNKIGFWV